MGKLYKIEKIRQLRFREDIPIGEDIVYNFAVLRQIDNAYFSDLGGYIVNNQNENSLTRAPQGKYDYRMDEEYQSWWGKIQREELEKTGIDIKMTEEQKVNGCSVWIFQKIMNLCYEDCPHSKEERLARIDRQIKNNRKAILRARHPSSPKTYAVILMCVLVNRPRFTFALFNILLKIKK